MKSLEIVNKAKEELEILINLINESIDSDYVLKNRPLAYRLLRSCELLYRHLDEDIKQYLEVLEILRKYLYLGGWEGDEDYPRDLRLEICDYSHVSDENKEEYEDYNKVKQWLEENEE